MVTEDGTSISDLKIIRKTFSAEARDGGRVNADEHGLKNCNLVRLRRGKQKGKRQAPAAD